MLSIDLEWQILNEISDNSGVPIDHMHLEVGQTGTWVVDAYESGYDLAVIGFDGSWEFVDLYG